MVNKFYLGSHDAFSAFGLIPEEGTFYAELLKLPSRKTGLTKNWADQHGTQRSFHNVEYDDRDLELKFYMYGTSKDDIFVKYNALKQSVGFGLPFDFKCVDLDRLFVLKYVSMPSFEKLTIFADNGKKYIKLSLSVKDENPTVFKNASGVLIPLTYPTEIIDGDIDFSAFTFKIVNGHVIMSGDGIGGNFYKINGNDIFSSYGLIPDEGLHNELLKFAEAKPEGFQKLQTRTLELPFYLNASSDIEFYYRYYALAGFLLDSAYFNFDVANLNKRFKLTYSAMTSFEKLTIIKGSTKIYAGLKITFFDDFPTLESGIVAFDGRFEKKANGRLYYSQSPIWDDKIKFLKINGRLIKRIYD